MKSTLLVARTLRAGNRDSLRIAGAALALTLALSTVPLRAFASALPLTASTVPVPVPNPIPPPLPIGEKLTAFSKDVYGESLQAHVVIRQCSGQITEEIVGLPLRMQLLPHLCDEGFSRAMLNGSFVATVDILRRKADLRGCFSGKWQLLSSSGAVLATGELSGTVGCGTHRPPGTGPCEQCKEPEHYEGKLTGQVLVAGPYLGAQICATLAGTGPLQPTTAQRMSLEGVVISRCVPGTPAGQ